MCRADHWSACCWCWLPAVRPRQQYAPAQQALHLQMNATQTDYNTHVCRSMQVTQHGGMASSSLQHATIQHSTAAVRMTCFHEFR
jgi:hypothetical protein